MFLLGQVLPDQLCWDVVEGASFEDVRKELGAMTGMPVDVGVSHRPGDSGTNERGVLSMSAYEGDQDCLTLRIEGEPEPRHLMPRSCFVYATITPGCVTAFFGESWIRVGRVNLVVTPTR